MSLLANIDDFATGTYTVTRRAAGSFTAGVFTDGATSTFTIIASVQPVTRDLKAVPEGRTVDEVRKIFTATRLKSSPTGPDSISIDGDPYDVYRVDGPWTMDGDTHYVCYAVRQVLPGAG